MQGLKLAREFYFTHGLPMIRDNFGHISDRIAVGLVGPGSECYGFDDELSRDHDWGAGFCLWLQQDDFETYGAKLSAAYSELPGSPDGFNTRIASPGEDMRIGVMSIPAFYSRYTGLDHPPQSLQEWLIIPEQGLSVCTNGIVLYDPADFFSAWRRHLCAYYPEDIRRKRIASRCMTVAQYGQYNFVRSLQRNEPFVVRYTEIQFCHDIMSLTFLLNRQYQPFYKWMHRATGQLPVLGAEIHDQITAMIRTTDTEEKTVLIEKMCCLIINEFHRQGLSYSDSSFLLDHAQIIQSGIQDKNLREHFKVFN
jgi:hypothetical protein